MNKRMVRIIECVLTIFVIFFGILVIKEAVNLRHEKVIAEENQKKQDKMYAALLYATDLNIKIKTDKNLLICNQISKDWSNAINKREDFNTAIQNTLQKAEDGGILKTLRDDKKSIENAMNKLNEPPEQYKNLYDKLLSLYGQYTKIYEQATSPSGSLLTYNSSVKEIYSEISRLSNEFEAIIPQDIKGEATK